MITTDRLLIRKFCNKDYKDLYEYLSMESVYEYEPGEPISLETAMKLAIERAKTNDFYAVVLKTEDKMVGHIYFQQIEPKEIMTWEIGYIFSPKYQKQGYATESAKALIHYSFQNFATHRVTAHCNPKNTASWKLLENIGMQREGLQRQNIFFRKDERGLPIWQDTYDYAILVTN